MSMRPLAVVFACSLLACSSTSHSDLGATADTGGPSPGADGGGTDGAGGTDDSATADDSSPGDDAGIDIFAGVDAFAPVTPKSGSGLVLRHKAEAGKSLSGADCSTSKCHDGANPEAPLLAFGGTVYYGPDATKPAPGVEVRVRDAAGKDFVVYSDTAGNFWQLGKPSTFAWSAHTGVRDATDSVSMIGDFKTPGCNASNCHDNTTDYPYITVPPPP